MYHSVLSSSLNIGLIHPSEIIEMIIQFCKDKPHINVEEYIKQLMGWRSYVRYIYLYINDRLRSSNYFNNTRKLNNIWYVGNTNIEFIDTIITQALKYGYLHNNQRIVIGSLMVLLGIHPTSIYKWFMEVCAIDAYDIYVIPNVYGLLGNSGDLIIKKIVLLSDSTVSKYINCTNKSWKKQWKSLYYNFIITHQEYLKNTAYIRTISYWNRINNNEQDKLLKTANQLIKLLTK
jgi:deoxyribodipyrimidine photolyase-related protein